MTAATVFVSGGGHRYHASRDCRALEIGQELNDWDCGEYCRHQHPNMHAVGEMPLDEAALLWSPCRRCKPGLPAAEDFGHEPFEYDGALICRRCWLGDDLHRDVVYWPCATARVLGITTEGAGQ